MNPGQCRYGDVKGPSFHKSDTALIRYTADSRAGAVVFDDTPAFRDQNEKQVFHGTASKPPTH